MIHMRDIIVTLIVFIVFYVIGGICVGQIANMMFPIYVPWIGILAAVIYAAIMIIVMTFVGNMARR